MSECAGTPGPASFVLEHFRHSGVESHFKLESLHVKGDGIVGVVAVDRRRFTRFKGNLP